MRYFLHVVNQALAAVKNTHQSYSALTAEQNLDLPNNVFDRIKTDSSSNSLRGNPRPNRYPCATLALPLRYVAMIFAVLTLSIGQVWGAEYALVSNPTGTPALTTNFRYGNLTLNKSTAATIDGIGFKKGIGFGSTLSSISGKEAGDNNIMYDVKTTSTKFTVYVAGATGTLYFSKIAEGATSTTVENKTISSNPQKIEFTLSSTTNTCVGFSVSSTSMYIYQIIAEETGTTHKQAGEAGYQLNLNKGRYAGNKASSNSGKSGSIDNIELATYDKIVCTSSSAIQLEKNSANTYIKFTTGTSAVNLKVTFSAGSLIVNTSKSTSGGTSLVTNTAQALAASTTYWIINTNAGNRASITKIAFEAASGVTNPSFSPATGSSLVKSTGTVTLSSSGNTVYYKWSQTNNQYASGAGATLAGAADGSGTSPVNATAPSTAGTWYLYAVAKNGSDYSDVVKATYTITNPTHTLTWNLDGGTATGGTAAGAVAEGATLTAPTVYKAGYDFAGWSPSLPATMPADDATYTATWTKVYASGTYNFYNNATLGTSPNQKTITTEYADYNAFRIDNIFFSAINMAYEGGSTATGSDYKGWKIKKNNATIKFFVENDSEVTISIGRDNTLNVSYTNTAGASQTPTITSGNSSTYSVKGGTMVTLTMSTSSTITIKQIAIAAIAGCTAPNHVDVTPTAEAGNYGWRYTIGETLKLTATPYSSEGTSSPITSGITGYQWQKYVGNEWVNLSNGGDISGATSANLVISNLTSSNGGSYRCVVSTGATCSLASDGYWVRVFTLNGNYSGSAWTENPIVWTGANTGVATINLNASSTYMFKVTDNDGKWFGYTANNFIIQPQARDCGTENSDIRLFTGPAGDYTFTINIQHAAEGSPYVNISVGYPEVTHPNAGYMYITKWWDCYIHYWEGTNNDLTAWGNDPKLNSDRYVEICGTNYWYFPVIATYNKFIAKDATGDAGNTTGDQVSTANGGKYITNDGSWGWHDFSTYSISFDAGGGTGTMSAIEGLCPNSSQAITANAFEKTGYTFNCWHADKAVKVGGSTISAGGDIAGGATLQEINNDITLTAQWTPKTTTITLDKNNSDASGSTNGSATVTYGSDELATYTAATRTGYTISSYKTETSGGSIIIKDDGSLNSGNKGDILDDGHWSYDGASITLYAQWTANKFDVTHTLSNVSRSSGGEAGSNKATYGTEYSVVFAASSGYTLPATVTVTIGGATQTAGTGYTWNQGTGTLTIPAAYVTGAIVITITGEEEGCTPTTASITFNNNVAGKYNTAWVAGDITTSGGATYSLTNCSVDNDHPMTKPAIKGAKNKTLIQINIPAGATSGTISVSAATYNGGAATIAITNSGGTVLASQNLNSTTTNADAGSWSAPTLKTASYNITSGGTYYIKETSNNNNIYIYAFSASGSIPCDETAPTFVSSVPANGATGVATSGTIVLTFSEALGSVDASKFTLTGATKGAVAIDGSDATKVNIAYSGAANEATVTLATAAAAVSDLAGNALAAALSNISFTTAAAGPEALIHWIVTVDASTWSLNGSPTTTDGTNITSISSSIDAAESPSVGASGTTAKVALAAASDNVSNAASFTFTVNSAKKVEPERVTCQVFNVGSGSGDQLSYKAQLSDNNGHVYYSTNSVKPASAATLTDATFTFASDLVLTGNVTMKVYGYQDGGTKGTAFRMGADVKLFGEVQNAADYTVTHTMSNVTKSAGATSVKEGNNYTATYAVAGDYALPENISVTIGGSPATAGTDYTWTQGTGVVTIPGNKVTGNIVITVTGVEASSILNVTYNGNGSTGGSVPTDDTDYEAGDIVTVKGNTGSLVKTGQSFLGWSTNATPSSGTFYPAGYKFEMPAVPVTLYAVWGTGSDCITITDFETSSHNNSSSSKPDSEGKYFYGYKGTKDASHAVTITATNGDCIGLNSGANLKVYGGKYVNIYADNTTTGGTPSTFTNVTSISIKAKVTNASYIATFDIMVGNTTIADNVSLSAATSSFQTYSYSGLNNLSGKVKIINNNSGSSSYSFLVDDIEICTGSGASGHTVSFDMNDHGSAIANIANVPDGSKIGAPIPEPTAVDWDFGGWYKEEGCTNAWDFASDVVSSNTTLYAKWTNCAPTISTHPLTASYLQNASATPLTVAADANGGGELSYQWWVKENDLPEEDGSAIPGETGTSFTPSTELLGTTYYYCVVSNDCGNVKTNTAAVTIRDTKPDPKAIWTVQEPTHGGKGFTFSVEVNKADDGNWDGTLEASMLTLSSEAVLDESSIVVNNTNKTISGTYGVKGSATSPVTFYLLLPATDTQAAKRLDYDQSFAECVGGSGDSYDIRVRKNYTKEGNYYHWANTDGWISQKISTSFSSEKASTKMGESNQFDSIYNTNGQYVWVRTYHANINKVRIYADFRANDMTVSNVYKHTDYFTANDKYIVSYTAAYNGSAATNLGDAAQGYVDITLEEPMNANDIVLVKFSDAKVRTLGAVLTEARSGGSLETALVWSNSQASGTTVTKSEDELDFTITANRSGANALASLGTINYSSSVPSVATVNAATGAVHIADNIDFGGADYKETTITALLNPSGCYKRSSITYVLRVNKYVCTEAAGTIGVVDRGCAGMDLTITGYEDGASIQWYKDGVSLGSASGAQTATYNATEPGEYHAVTYKTCYITSTNSVTLEAATATAEKIVDSWYVKNGRRTPDIALVQTTGATSFTITSGGTPVENIGGCTFELKDDGIIYLHGQKENGDAPSDMTAGDMTITITVSGCAGTLSGLDITIHKQAETAKPNIAFVVDGTLRKDGGTASSVLTAKTSDRPIWIYLSESYDLTGCNAYWSVNSKELREYYSQFDAILITDDPNTSTNGTGGVSYVKALGTMVDVRPILTMEAYVGKFKDGGWHVYNASPSSPNPRQVEMKLECKNHDIFKGLDPATSENVRMTLENGNEYWHVIMVDTTLAPYHNTTSDYEALPALQGFDPTKFDHMLGVGTIFNETLQGGVERQEEPAARMMILGIQNNAMGALTTEGKLVIKNALDYLLKTNMEDVNDCSNYFTAAVDNLWDNNENWSRGEVPDFETRARILKPVVIPGSASAQHVARVDIAASGKSKHIGGEECNGSITIEPQGALIVEGKVSRAKAPNFGIDDLMPTENSDLYIRASAAGNGTLIMDNSDGQNKAYVEMYSKAQNNGGTTTWQYIGVPHSDVNNAQRNYYDSWLYSWNPTNGWEVVVNGGAVQPWTGYSITHPEAGHTYVMEGTLAATGEVDIDVPANSFQIIGNSWTAPIQIHNFEDDDFGDIEPTIYFFNTGLDEDGTGTLTPNATGEARWAAGTYVSVPIHSSPYLGKDSLISSLQGFYVTNNAGAATLHLDYDKLVRPMYPWQDLKSGPMHAPASMKMRNDDKPVVAKLFVSGNRYDDRLVILERSDFSRGYDRGWDGEKWAGNNASPMIWVDNENGGAEAVMATDDLEGTVIGFRAGEDEQYTFYFNYDGMEEALYLLDLDTKIYTRMLEENNYTFNVSDKDTHYRFILTRKNPEVATDIGNIQSDPVPSIKAKKLLIGEKLYILLNGTLYDATGKVVK